MCSGSPGPRALDTRCSQVAEVAWPDHMLRVAGKARIDEAKIAGITPAMLSFSGRNEVWFMYALRPPWRRANFIVIWRWPRSTNTANQGKAATTASIISNLRKHNVQWRKSWYVQ